MNYIQCMDMFGIFQAVARYICINFHITNQVMDYIEIKLVNLATFYEVSVPSQDSV